MYYIQESDKPNFFFRKFNIIKMEGNKIILPFDNIPNKKEDGCRKTKSEEKLALKTNKLFKKLNSRKVVLSKEIKKHTTYLNLLQTYGLDIVDGKWLFKMLIPEIVYYVEKQKDIKPYETTIQILINDFTEVAIENIKKLTQSHKHISVVTKHIEKMKKIEEQILEETGAMITVMNNKKKSLAKSNIIINMDFSNELINQYVISENATIIDTTSCIKIQKKRFEGKVIKNYEIMRKNREEYQVDTNLYYQRDLYESEFYKNQPYKYVRDKIKKDGVYVVHL